MTEANSGHLKWGKWALDYGVFGKEGLCLVDGYFAGQKMFYKLSLPVIRVKYVRDEYWHGASSLLGVGCGPYNDQITWDPEDLGETVTAPLPGVGQHHLVKVDCPGGDRYICTDEVDVGGVPHVRLGVYARIGAYHIYESWSLNDDGMVLPRVSSKGLSCNLDHWHHPYWRFDFALGDPPSHRLTVNDTNGVPFASIGHEGGVVNDSFGKDIVYCITSTQSPDIGLIKMPAQALIRPPVINEMEGIVGPTDWAPLDGYVRTYRPQEDVSWPHPPENDIAFDVHEPCDDSAIVFWSINHISHHESEGEEHWHTVGPDLTFIPMLLAGTPPEANRRVRVSGNMAVKDFGVLGHDLEHSSFEETLLIDPNARVQEVVHVGRVGDVTAQLVLRIEWQLDYSLKVHVAGSLFDELERTAYAEHTFTVAPDTTLPGSGNLVDHHGGDPDTANMDFEIENGQQ